MKIITPEQWLKVDLKFPVFYNGSNEVVSIRQEKGEEIESVMSALPGHLVQLNSEQAFLMRITPEGRLEHFVLYSDPEDVFMKGFNPTMLLSALRGELDEILIRTNN